ncbi:MAG TPA: AMP-binding protein [Actinotalea caeni]|uniref:AMP-binding protein n=1 Tax=Actinotalea caeni TaxID=1348467 RepID=UPI002B4AD0DE|nr:AMP-binding protein [Actinotalea caeni]HLV54527.1 AMP-binding protein [Actinotalea caeni]
MSARTPAWHAVPDAVGVAGQWRPADLRGLPATLRYGATLSGVALAAARGRPRKVLLVDGTGPVRGAELEAAADVAARGLARAMREARDLGRREVGVCAGNHRGLLAGLTAAGALGLDAVLVPPSAGRELLTAAFADLDVVLTDTVTEELVASTAPHARRVDTRARPDGLGGSLRSVPRPRRAGRLRLLTSGTTGTPKTVERGGAAIGQLATVLSLMRALELRRDEPVVLAPSVAHGHGLSVLTAALVVGAPVVMAHGADGAELVELVHAHDAGVLAVVPAQLADVLHALEDEVAAGAPLPELPTLRRVVTGSAPLTAGLVERARALLGDIVVDFYGSSEAGTATIARPDDLRTAPGTVGRPAAGVRVEIVDDGGAPVPVGVVGQVRISSPWRAAEQDAALQVGDLGHLDEQGRLFLDGRADDLVDVGGHLVSTSRVRDWFAQQPGVRDAVVHVLDHSELGHELLVEVTGSADVTELRERALAELGPASAPRLVERDPR